MIARLAWAAVLLLGARCPGAPAELSEAQVEGRQLARQLRELRPAENSRLAGVLKIRESRSRRWEIPVLLETVVTATNWFTRYTTSTTNNHDAVSLLVVRCDDRPNQYRLSKPAPADDSESESRNLSGEEAMIPFAGSDFWLADLGLEFLYWPEQRLLKKELRKGQSCYVLESTRPPPVSNGYARVVSWIDMDSGGIIHADAYDANRRLLKQFDPQKLKKVNGQWQLREMEMYNAQTRSRTRIEFDLDVPEAQQQP